MACLNTTLPTTIDSVAVSTAEPVGGMGGVAALSVLPSLKENLSRGKRRLGSVTVRFRDDALGKLLFCSLARVTGSS